jgi:hypothetical protein
MLELGKTYRLAVNRYNFAGKQGVPEIIFGEMAHIQDTLCPLDKGYCLPWRVFSTLNIIVFERVNNALSLTAGRIPIGIYEDQRDHLIAVLK